MRREQPVFFDGAEVIQVIHTRLLHRGAGTEENPHRIVEQFWSLDGELLAENDPWSADARVET